MLLLATAGCKLTEIVVATDTDLTIPADIDTIDFEAAYVQDGDKQVVAATKWPVDRTHPEVVYLPVTVGLLPGDQLERPVLITARGLRGDTVRLTRRARLPFDEGRVLLVRTDLLRICLDVVCPPDQTCGQHGCEPINKNPSELPDYTPELANKRVVDAGPDGAIVPDSGPDGPLVLDAGIDQGLLLDAPPDGPLPDAPPDAPPDALPDAPATDAPPPPPDASVTDAPLTDGPPTDAPPSPDAPPTDYKPPDGGAVVGSWVTVVNGTFNMGSLASEPCRQTMLPNEWDYQVTLTNDFVIQATETTQGEFANLMGYNPSYFGPNGAGPDCGANCPVENVDWHEAVAYCNKLSANASLPQCYNCSGSGSSVICTDPNETTAPQQIYACTGYRLPTDAEWEYAYRATTTTPYYNGLNDPTLCQNSSVVDTNADMIAWYLANAGGTTHLVGQKDPNLWNLYDMAGNVWEWVHDVSSTAYTGLDSGLPHHTNPVRPWPGGARTLRGGSVQSHAEDLRAARRGSAAADQPLATGTVSRGFRCARTL